MRRMVKASVSLLILIAVLWAIWTYHTDELYGESFSSPLMPNTHEMQQLLQYLDYARH